MPYLNKWQRVVGASIVLMMEQYKRNKGFSLDGVLFPRTEITAKANELFSSRSPVNDDDVKNLTVGIGSSTSDKYLSKGFSDSLAEYYRLCYPNEATAYDLRSLIEELEPVLLSYIPRDFSRSEQFVSEYFAFIKEIEFPEQKKIELNNRESRIAVWIAAATLTYNEYIRTKSHNLLQYAFKVGTLDALAQKFVVNVPSYGYNALTATKCTKDSSDPSDPFLIKINTSDRERRRMSQPGEVENTKPENLPLDFMVNTITGTVPVRTLVEFMDDTYAHFANEAEVAAVDIPAIQPESTLPSYGKEQFLSEVYMDSEDYDKLVSLIGRKKNVILQGAPGTGKTFCAKKLAYSMMGEKAEKRVQTVQFHQGYSYEDFVEGYRPKETGYALEKGIFYNFCTKADTDREHDYFFIIDEMNRGNLSKILGELFTLLEKSKRGEEIRLVYSGEPFSIPENVYLIGLMNTADRSLAMIDYALRRRFGFFTMKPGFDTTGFKQYKTGMSCSQFDKLIERIKELNKEITNDDSLGEGFCIGHSFFCELDSNNLLTDLESIVENEIIPLLEEYWFDERDNVKNWVEELRRALA